MRFEFATAARIIFGRGTLTELPVLAREFGRSVMVVTGRDPNRAQRLLNLLADAKLTLAVFSIEAEPTTEDIARGVKRARDAGCDLVIGFGGGSALDAAKAISALLTNDGDLFDYLEIVGRGKPLARPAAPCIEIPTTAGTGSEVTRNAVISAAFAAAPLDAARSRARVKVSLRGAQMLPRVALVDSELTYDLPATLTATTGLDALTQLIEPYVSSRANPLTDSLCVEGIRRVARSLRLAVEDGRQAGAREDMALASLFGGLALANAGLGAVHGFAAPVGGMFSAPHGAVCATLLPHVMDANIRALRTRLPEHDALRRYAELARLLTGRADAGADDGVHWIRNLVSTFQIPTLATYGVTATDFPPIVEAAARASSMKANPLRLSDAELGEILICAM